MKNLILLISLCFAASSFGAAVYPQGSTIKAIKNSFTMKNNIKIVTGSLDPSVAGFVSPIGSTYESDNGKSYKKTGAADTDWTMSLLEGSIPLTDTYVYIGDATGTAVGVDISGEASILNTGAITLDNDSVIGKLLTGFTSGAGTVAATDSILQGIQKLDGNLFKTAFTISGTSIIEGGLMSMGTVGTISITAGNGRIVDNFTDINNPTINNLVWGAMNNIPVTTIATGTTSQVAIDGTGTVIFKNTGYTDAERRDYIVIGTITHIDGVNVLAVANVKSGSHVSTNQDLGDFARVIGSVNDNGNVYFANGANLLIDRTSGNYFSMGANYDNSKKDPNNVSVSSCSACTFLYAWRDGSGSFNAVGAATIIPGSYDDGTGGGLIPNGSVSNNSHSIQRLYIGGHQTIIQYGQETYNSQTAALNALDTEVFEQAPILNRSLFRGYLIVKGSETNLTNALFIEASRYGMSGSSGAATNSWVLSHVDNITNPNNVDDACNTIWVADASAGAVIITLPDSASANSECINKFILGTNTNNLTVTTVGGTQLIGGLTSQIIDKVDKGFEVISDPSVPEYLITQDSRNNPKSELKLVHNDTPDAAPVGQIHINAETDDKVYIVNSAAEKKEIITVGSFNHNDLGSIQGGTTAEYYHTTSAEHTAMVTTGNSVTLSNKTLDSSTVFPANVVQTTGTQTIGGAKTFSSTLDAGNGLLRLGYNTAASTNSDVEFYYDGTTQIGYVGLDAASNIGLANIGGGSVAISTSGTNRMSIGTTGIISITGTGGGGGNLPHNCAMLTATTITAQSVSSTCGAGKIAVGGRCQTYGANLLNAGLLAGGGEIPVSWNCFYSAAGGSNVAQALCCTY